MSRKNRIIMPGKPAKMQKFIHNYMFHMCYYEAQQLI